MALPASASGQAAASTFVGAEGDAAAGGEEYDKDEQELGGSDSEHLDINPSSVEENTTERYVPQ
jgi:hypothetical protein